MISNALLQFLRLTRNAMFLMLLAEPLASFAATNELWFPVGEKLTYKLYWGVIRVGTSHLTSEWLEKDGKRYVVLKATARTTAVVNKIYPVEDYIESTVDPETFLPVKYVQKLMEGCHIRDDTIIFDHNAHKAYWTSGLTNAVKVIEIGSDTRDVLTLTYYMRPKGTEIGAKEDFRVLVDDKLYSLGVTVLDRENMKIPGFGKVMNLKVEPKARFGAIFVRKGKVLMWFSDDTHRICTKMVGEVPVANVKAILTGVEGWEDGKWGGSTEEKTGPAGEVR
jgi:hypothetical protein